MYFLLLVLHSGLRWIVIALGLAALARALTALRRRAPWGRTDERLARGFLAALDTQVLVGIVLWLFFSPFAQVFRQSPGAAMRDSMVRFWGMEHQVGMLLAFLAAHVGRSLQRRRADARAKHRTQAIALLVWTALVASSFPWPGTGHARPLLRVPEATGLATP
ncbi:MAG: hypothetical protein QM820_57160 [Minicystis sp.]